MPISYMWFLESPTSILNGPLGLKECNQIVTIGPMTLIPEEPAQSAVPVQRRGTRVVCGHCRNTFLWVKSRFNTLTTCPHCRKVSSVGGAHPCKRCYEKLIIGVIFIFIAVALTVGMQGFARTHQGAYFLWAFAYSLGWLFLREAQSWGGMPVSYPEHSFA
ncbi:type 2 phosphatidylinositol 4,5-bisphosphate 4-phosphatase-like [Ambystoma mexicanum]|uniref:type 2 phosphatidylinositol 4,5-bisphosphate 4-phosphatase-like n=1 Tax=Ambystoma mexicanum TaxID=8296 RepID=UPI0037E7DA01